MMKAFVLFGISAAVAAAHAGCDISITSVTPCDQQGNPVTVTLGQHLRWGLRVAGTIKGTPNGTLYIRVGLGNKSGHIMIPHPVEGPFVGHLAGNMPIDDVVHCSAMADPFNSTGDTNYANNTRHIDVTPVPPATGINYYDPRLWRCERTAVLSFSGTGIITEWHTVWGLPRNLGYQEIGAHYQPTSAQVIPSTPFNDPVLNILATNLREGTHSIELVTDLGACNVRVNPTILRTVNWGDELNPPTDVAAYLQRDPLVNWEAPIVAEFVAESLPADYRTTMTPYDVARTLFKRTVGRITYGYGGWNAETVLQTGYGDCGGFSVVFAAACRRVGIPARCISGFSEGTNAFHMWAEFWLAGHGWVPVDGSAGDANDPLGSYAYWFGYAPSQNNRVGVSAATEHTVTGIFPNGGLPVNVGFLQLPFMGYNYVNPQNIYNKSVTVTHRLIPR